MNIVNDND
jgi:hypothetical protein